MNFTCDQCQRRYAIPDERIRGKTLQVRCKNCQHILVLTWKPPDEEAEEATRAVPLSELLALQGISKAGGAWEAEPTKAGGGPDPGPWFVLVHGSQQGPVPVKELTNRIRKGQITQRTYVWRQGMKDWLRASEVADLIPLFSPPEPEKPPPPVRAAPTLRGPGRSSIAPEPGLEGVFANLGAQVPWTDGPKAKPAAARAPAPASVPPPAQRTPPPLSTPLAAKRTPAPARKPPPEQPELTEEALLPEIPEDDPFANLDLDEPDPEVPGEATAFFIAQARVHKRNPPWKIAALVVGLMGVPILVLFLLSRMKVVPLEVTRVDATGKETKQSVFSAQGVAGLKDILLGKQNPPQGPIAPDKRPPVTPPKLAPKTTPPPAVPDASTPPPPLELKALYGDSQKTDIGPKVAKVDPAPKPEPDTSEGPAGEEVKRVVDQTQGAFQFCIEQHTRKHPNFRGGKVNLTATVGTSGVVKKTMLDRRDIEDSELGTCLKAKAKRMVFSSFAGDEVDLQIPLILTTTL